MNAHETTAQHTPGPWHVNAIRDGRIVGDETAERPDKLLIANHNATVATVYRPRDARLIASAPELLALLTRALPRLQEQDGDDARALLARLDAPEGR